MRERPEIKQVSTKGSQGAQVGIQNINVGMSPQTASEIAINLFMENFPKLQEEAGRIVRKRADELLGEIINKLEDEGVKDYSAFREPDVQYILLEAQKKYARFGTTEMLKNLSVLLCKRIQGDKDFILKITIDKAIEIAPMLTSEQLDYLSLLFFCKNATLENIKTLSQFKKEYTEIAEKYKSADFTSTQYLLMHGCLDLNLNNVVQKYAKRIGVTEKEVEDVCPEIVKKTYGDYAPSYVGIILAILNEEIKYGQKLDPHIWIS